MKDDDGTCPPDAPDAVSLAARAVRDGQSHAARPTEPAGGIDDDNGSDPYTAVMLVHGIGRPNRNENIGRLIDLIEQATSDPAAPPRAGIFRTFRPRFERHRCVPLRTMAFVSFRRFTERRLKHLKAGVKWVPRARYRAYEVHWAPLGKMPPRAG